MRILLSVSALASLLGNQPPSTDQPQEEYTDFPELGISLLRPEGFESAQGFQGFRKPAEHAAILAVTLPASFAQFESGFTAPALQERGMVLLNKRYAIIAGQPGLLLHLTQNVIGVTFEKWIGIIGDNHTSCMITASYLPETASRFSDLLKSTILSARLCEKAPGPGPGFTIVPAGDLKAAPTMGKTLLFTRDGVAPVRSPEEPIFVGGPSLGRPTLERCVVKYSYTVRGSGARRWPAARPGGIPVHYYYPAPARPSRGQLKPYSEFALDRVRQIAKTRIHETRSHDPITVDELSGYETVAGATEITSGASLQVYQVLLFDEDLYYLFQGLVGDTLAPEYLPHFQAMTRSFKRD